MKYRTIEEECFTCGYITRFHITLRDEFEKWSGFFRKALPETACPKCCETARLIEAQKKEAEI